jgi:Anti-sigma factor NepR
MNARNSVTNLHTPSTVPALNTKHALVEQQAMAKERKLGNSNESIESDPISAALKQLHDAVANEELPDDFMRLLDEIDTKIASKKATH